jgi:hypothetical protein
MSRSIHISVLVGLVGVLAACSNQSGSPASPTDDSSVSDSGTDSTAETDDPLEGAHLVFSTLPVSPVSSGAKNVLGVALDDDDGALLPLDVEVVLRVDGEEKGRTLLADGVGSFPLVLLGCSTAQVEIGADGVTGATVTLGVVPQASLLAGPRVAAEDGPISDVSVSFSDAGGAPVEVDGTTFVLEGEGKGVTFAGASSIAAGDGVTFFGLSADGEGRLDVSIVGAGACPLRATLCSLLVSDSLTVVPAFLAAAREGTFFTESLEATPEILGSLPPGLEVGGGTLSGVPTLAGTYILDAALWASDGLELLRTRLSVLPSVDDALPDPTIVPSDPGPYPTESLDLTIPSITVSHGTYSSVRMRVTVPSDGSGDLPEGTFPVISFHHAAHSPVTIYDRYTDLHEHWASWGVIVASVDSSVNVSGRSQSWQNLEDMSTFQLAAAEQIRALGSDSSSPLFGHVDGERVFVSGHSRGGGASLISLWRDPTLLGAIVFEPVSPLQTPYQDWTDPDGNGDRPFPVRPILMLVGSLDADEPWPLPDLSYEQTEGPAAVVTIEGANHEDTMDAGTPGGVTSTSTISREERHDLDKHYSTAFLSRFGGVGHEEGEISLDASIFLPEGLMSDLSSEGVCVHGRRFVSSEIVLDDFQDPDHPDVNALEGANVGSGLLTNANDEPYAEGLEAVGRYDERGTRIGTWGRARRLAWDVAASALRMEFDPIGAPFDLSADDVLAMRVARYCPPPGRLCPDEDVDFDVVLVDSDGNRASEALSHGMGELGIVGRSWSTARLDLDDFPGVDLSRVVAVELDLSSMGWEGGEVWVDDVRVE